MLKIIRMNRIKSPLFLLSTKWFVKAVSLGAVPGGVWGGQSGVGGAHWEAGVRGPVTGHITSLLIHIWGAK